MKSILIEQAKKTIDVHAMLHQGDVVLAGVSGGPDSVALLLLLGELSAVFSLKIGIAHLNHMLRGKESDRDESFVSDLAAELNIPCHVRRSNVSGFARENRLSLEEAAREIRYKFYHELADEEQYTKIALGHNSDDNAEQVLMNLLRGSGAKGLAGIPPRRGRRIIRPLIQVSRKNILTYLSSRDQAYVMDSSNAEIVFLRNRIRNKLLPMLKEEYNPEVTGALNRLSRIARGEEEWMEGETRTVFRKALRRQTETEVHLDSTYFQHLHPALARRLIRHALQEVKHDLRRISLGHIEDILKLNFHGIQGKSLDLPGKIRVFNQNKCICFKRELLCLRELGKRQKKNAPVFVAEKNRN